jgi:crossover junction endodeoxyribonuclease RuvC
MADFHVLGIDPGFASIGWSVVRIDATGEHLVDLGVIRTEKSAAKRNVRASEDNLERAKEIAQEIQDLIGKYRIQLVCAETMSYPRNSSAAAKMAMCWGVMAAIAQQHKIPIAQATPQEVKKAVTGRKDASKEEVQEAVRGLFPALQGGEAKHGGPYILRAVPRSLWEHPYDATAAVVACRESEVFLLARRMASCADSTKSSSPAT